MYIGVFGNLRIRLTIQEQTICCDCPLKNVISVNLCKQSSVSIYLIYD